MGPPEFEPETTWLFIGLAGKVPIQRNNNLQTYFDVLMPIGHQPFDLATALEFTAGNLIRTSTELGNLLAIVKWQPTDGYRF